MIIKILIRLFRKFVVLNHENGNAPVHINLLTFLEAKRNPIFEKSDLLSNYL
jgi:hypothetical protein